MLVLAHAAMSGAETESVKATSLIQIARAHHALGDFADAHSHYVQVCGGSYGVWRLRWRFLRCVAATLRYLHLFNNLTWPEIRLFIALSQ